MYSKFAQGAVAYLLRCRYAYLLSHRYAMSSTNLLGSVVGLATYEEYIADLRKQLAKQVSCSRKADAHAGACAIPRKSHV